MRTLKIKQVDAFSRTPWGGNAAGVVIDSTDLSELDMQGIAREMNLSETAFVLPSRAKGADLRLRWFTPAYEVDLCGHATIASFHALSEEEKFGMEREGRYRFTVETRSGLLGIEVDKSSSGDSIQFELPLPAFQKVDPVPPEVLDALGISKEDMHSELPVVKEAYAYVPVRSLSVLHQLQPSSRVLTNICQSMGVGGISVFTLETIDKTSAVHSRFFAPALGVDEDPVTGSANGPLGVYLGSFVKEAGLEVATDVLSDGRIEYVGEQGDVLGRPGRVTIRTALEGQEIRRVWIAGHAVTVMEATLRLPERED